MGGDSCNGLNAAPDEASRPRACLEPGRNLQGSEGTGGVVRQRSRVRWFRRHVTDQGGISLTGKIREPAAGDHTIEDRSVVRGHGNCDWDIPVEWSQRWKDAVEAWTLCLPLGLQGLRVGSAARPKPRQSCA